MATPALLQQQFPLDPNSPRTTRRAPSPDRLWVHALLFVVTLASTTLVGMRYADNFHHGLFPLASDADIFPYRWTLAHLGNFAQGLPFSCTLLGILLTHEFGHFFACRRYGIRATLPYMLPAPSLSGTAGAVIRLKSRIRSRSALLSIGGFGPLAGFSVAVVTSIIGLHLSHPVAAEPMQLVHFAKPMLIILLMHALGISTTAPLLWHPVFIASWIGLLITSLNLLPAGQLDGGHVLYALSKPVHRTVTYVVMAALVVCGIYCWLGWLLWAALLALPGMRHPNVPTDNDISPKLRWLAPLSLIIFLLCATPSPFSDASLRSVAHRVITHSQHR